MARKIKYIALEGGGLKGIAHLGVFQCLMEIGLWEEVDTLSGSSAGALAALVGATGWNFETMYKRFRELDLEKMITTDSAWANVPLLGSVIEATSEPYHFAHNMHTHLGMHRAKAIEQWIESVVHEVSGIKHCTFKQWHNLRHDALISQRYLIENSQERKNYSDADLTRIDAHSRLKDIAVEAGNTTTRFNETFSWKTEHCDVPIAQAIRASMAFPIYLAPVLIKGNYYIDGGALRNCPGEMFEKQKGRPHPKLVCVMLEDREMIEFLLQGKAPVSTPVRHFPQFLSRVLSMLLGVQTNDLRDSPYLDYTVFCDTKSLSTFDFDAIAGHEDELIESGRLGAISHFHTRFPELVCSQYASAIIKQALSTTVQPRLSAASSLSDSDDAMIGNVCSSAISMTPQFELQSNSANQSHNATPSKPPRDSSKAAQTL